MPHRSASSLSETIGALKHQRRTLIRQLNDTEERLAALHLAQKLLRTNRSHAVNYAQEILGRTDELGSIDRSGDFIKH